MADYRYGQRLYRTRGAMLEALAYDWVSGGGVSAAGDIEHAFATCSDAVLARECVVDWELDRSEPQGDDPDAVSHMQEHHYTEADLVDAFAAVRRQWVEGHGAHVWRLGAVLSSSKGAYNQATQYGFGTEAEAWAYCDILNKGRAVNLYAPQRMSDGEARADRAIEDSVVNLEDALAADAGVR